MERPVSDRRVIVGIDGSDNSSTALRWAVDKAAVLGSITPVLVTPSPAQDPLRSGNEAEVAAARDSAWSRLREAVASVAPDLVDVAAVVEAHPGRGLLEAAADADLLVVGTRGQGGLTSALLGSVSAHCASTAEIPVIIVPPEVPTDRPLLDVVVGVDGSANADSALRWGIEHLAPGGRLRAVGALPIWGDADDGSGPLEQRLGDRVQAAIDRVLDETPIVQDPSSDAADREIVITIEPRDARVALREAADGADLLVIGRRGLSRLTFLVVGSVTAAMTHHPTVPTVVIPGVETPLLSNPDTEETP